MVVNNPESNMGNAIGICPVLQLPAGDPAGHGHRRLYQRHSGVLKVALCSQRARTACPTWAGAGHGHAVQEQRQDRRAVLYGSAGYAEAGAAADIIVMDYKPFTPFSDENIGGHMIFGMTGRQCQTTIAAGRF